MKTQAQILSIVPDAEPENPSAADAVVLTLPDATTVVPPAQPVVATRRPVWQQRLSNGLSRLLPGGLGMLLLLVIWQIAALSSKGFPTPWQTWQAAQSIFCRPFLCGGP
ncbi:hypothetical protein OS21_34810 [Dickeya oryzae]